MKIGELARKYQVLPSTIHYYTMEGLLKPDGYTRGGYRLYKEKNALARLRQIAALQASKRLSINEIKKTLRP